MMAYRKKNKGDSINIKKVKINTLRELTRDISICVYENSKILIYMLQVFFFILFCGLSYYVDLSICALLFTSSLFITEYLFRLFANVKHDVEDYLKRKGLLKDDTAM